MSFNKYKSKTSLPASSKIWMCYQLYWIRLTAVNLSHLTSKGQAEFQIQVEVQAKNLHRAESKHVNFRYVYHWTLNPQKRCTGLNFDLTHANFLLVQKEQYKVCYSPVKLK